jgi:hypothetical protein
VVTTVIDSVVAVTAPLEVDGNVLVGYARNGEDAACMDDRGKAEGTARGGLCFMIHPVRDSLDPLM